MIRAGLGERPQFSEAEKASFGRQEPASGASVTVPFSFPFAHVITKLSFSLFFFLILSICYSPSRCCSDTSSALRSGAGMSRRKFTANGRSPPSIRPEA